MDSSKYADWEEEITGELVEQINGVTEERSSPKLVWK
jgi:hypothetical protein